MLPGYSLPFIWAGLITKSIRFIRPDVLAEGSLHLGGVLESVEPDLEDVVDECEQRRQRVRRREQRHVAVLDY